MKKNSLSQKYKNTTFILSIIYFTMTIVSCSSNDDSKQHNYIAHAGGEIEGYLYTNSKEAIEHALTCGIRYIELDLVVTSDNFLVAAHDWEFFRRITNTPPYTAQPLSKQQFIQAKIYNKFTPLTADDIIDILYKYPDLILVTDKISDPNILHPYFANYANRVIVECFSDNDYYNLETLGYTCFRSTPPPSRKRYYKKLLRSHKSNINKFVASFYAYDYQIHRPIPFYKKWYIHPPKCEMALFTCKDRITADSVFSVYPNVKFIYVDNIENP